MHFLPGGKISRLTSPNIRANRIGKYVVLDVIGDPEATGWNLRGGYFAYNSPSGVTPKAQGVSYRYAGENLTVNQTVIFISEIQTKKEYIVPCGNNYNIKLTYRVAG